VKSKSKSATTPKSASTPTSAAVELPASESPAGFRSGTVAIIGRPNVGKSTLLNHLVGQKVSITSSKAQTTRHRIMGISTDETTQFLFLDTPGFQKAHQNALNRVLNQTVSHTAQDADVVVWAVEALRFLEADAMVQKTIPANAKVILAITKSDYAKDKSLLLPFLREMESKFTFVAIVPVTVKNVATLEELKLTIRPLLPEQPAIYGEDELTDKSERFLAAEFIREKIFRQVGDELPYSVNVLIEKFEIEGAMRRIHATIVVEKQSQKGIIIGEKGERLKRIGTDARKEMEATFGNKVFLEIWVRVKKGWADDDAMVKQYGYQS
jgi:GTPase